MSSGNDFQNMRNSLDAHFLNIEFIEEKSPSSETVMVNGRYYSLVGDAAKISWLKAHLPELSKGITLDALKERLVSLGAADLSQAHTIVMEKLGIQPQNSAEKLFYSWLHAFNNGDKKALEDVGRRLKEPERDFANAELTLYERIGGFHVVKIIKETPTEYHVLLREKFGFQEYALLTLAVDQEIPYSIAMNLGPTDAIELEPVSAMSEKEAIHAIEEEITRLGREGTFAGSVLVAKIGNPLPLVSRAVGMADVESGSENSIDTKYNLGSMNKMFTTIAILQLVEEAKISLDDPIGKYLKSDLDPELGNVTVRQLLTHTGGTGSIEGILDVRDPKDYMQRCQDRTSRFSPGTDWEYSNYGFVLLGALIEEVTKKSYYDAIRERVYEKAGMNDTDSYFKTEAVQNMAKGYMRTRDGLRDNHDMLPLRGSPAGGGYSTAADLQRFAEELCGNTLVSEKTRALLTKRQEVAPGNYYALGFQTGDLWYGHEGRVEGVNSELRIYPHSGYVVTVLGNLDPPAAHELAQFIGSRLPLLENVRPTIQVPGAPEKVSVVDRMNALGIHGVSIAICKDGDVVEQGFGDIKATHTLVQAASISKTVTALTILSLVEEGRILSLDDDVSYILGKELWDSIDPNGICDDLSPKMTIRQLLSHTAGLREDDERGFQGYGSDTEMLPTLDAILKGEGTNSQAVLVDSKPGSRFAYSGGGTMILQKVIEIVTGDFERAVQKRVFDKLGLKDSCFTLSDASTPVHGEGPDYKPLAGKWMRQPELAAAGLWTTAHDLAKIAVGIQRSLSGARGALIGKELAKEMVTAQSQEANSALGVFVEKVEDTTYFYHDGSNIGYRCIMVANDKGDGAVVMTNSDHGNDIIPELIRTISEEYDWQGREHLSLGFPPVPPSRPVEKVDVKEWHEKYRGKYQFDDQIIDSSDLVPLGENVGCYKGLGEAIFKVNEWGITSFVYDRRNRINRTQWAEKFLGSHAFGTLYEKDNKFYAKLGQNEPFEIWPISDGFRDAIEGPPKQLFRLARDETTKDLSLVT